MNVYTINVSVAGWQYLFGDFSREIISNRPGRVLDFIFAYPLFLLFFASPRFMFLRRNFTWYSLTGALLIIGYFVWRSLDYVFII